MKSATRASIAALGVLVATMVLPSAALAQAGSADSNSPPTAGASDDSSPFAFHGQTTFIDQAQSSWLID